VTGVFVEGRDKWKWEWPLLTHGAIVTLRAEEAVHQDYGWSFARLVPGRVVSMERKFDDIAAGVGG
jgi:hypothetical protein